MIIMKFGGSSLATAERIQHVGTIVETYLKDNPVLVLSAIGKTTDNLIAAGQAALSGCIDCKPIANLHTAIIAELALSNTRTGIEELLDELLSLLQGISISKELTPKTLDQLLSFGERLSARLFCAYLCQQGMNAQPIDGWSAGLRTTSDFNRAEILPETYENISTAFKSFTGIPVVTGFIAKDAHGSITTLGRGGSDLTAAVLGAALEASEIQVWKDVNGIMSTDPKLLETAIPIPSISFEEAAELAYFGAKVLHPASILPAMRKAIPVRVKNSYDPDHPGTVILSKKLNSTELVTAITYKQSQTLLHIYSTRMLSPYGFLAKVFQIFADLKISIDVIATSEVNISLTLDNYEKLPKLEQLLKEIATVRTQQYKTIITLIINSNHSSQILANSLEILSKERIEIQMISHGASKINTSLVVDDSEAKRTIHLLHKYFFTANTRATS